MITSWEEFEKYPWPRPRDIEYSSYERAIAALPDDMGIIGQYGDIFTTAWEMMGESRRAAFCSQLEHHERFYLEHMRLEEEELMPLAERHLLEEDWRILDRAFGARRDPLAHGRPEAPYEALLATLRPWLPEEAADRAA